MSRAGWHAKHLRHGAPQTGKSASANTRGDRTRLLKEAMRALDESDAARQAARNPSIVAADTHLNTAYVNDGQGGLRKLTKADGVEPVVAYGDQRIDAVKRKWHEAAFETTTIVSWVPKSLLDEVPDYYPVYDEEGVEIGRRSRWVMPQDPARRAEVNRWFRETHKHLIGDVLRGGHDAVHGVVWNFDESAVHVHWMCDTMAPPQKDMTVGADRQMLDADGAPVVKYKKSVTLDKVVKLTADDTVAHAPEIRADQIAGIDGRGYLVDAEGSVLRRTTGERVKASEDLRVEAQQMWGQSSEVTETRVIDGVEKQVKITGATKMARYQEGYREHLIEAGFDVALEVNPEGTSLDKSAFAHHQSRQTELDEREKKLAAELAEKLADAERRQARVRAEMEALDERAGRLKAAQTSLAERESALIEREKAFEADRVKAVEDVNVMIDEANEKFAQAEEELAAAKTDRAAAASDRAAAKTDRAAAATERQAGYDAGREEADEKWKTETEPTLRAEIRAEIEDELADDRKAAEDARQAAEADRDEARRRLSKIPDYDPKTVVQGMRAAWHEAGLKVRLPKRGPDGKPVRDEEGKPVWETANDAIDREATRIYNARKARGTQDETVAESSARTARELDALRRAPDRSAPSRDRQYGG